MIHSIPLIPNEERLRLRQLIESGLDENIALVFQICLGKKMDYWQIFSLIGCWMPMKRVHLYAGLEDAESSLWGIKINQVKIELIEFEYQNFHYDYYLRMDERQVNLKQYYHRKMDKRQSYDQIQDSFVRGTYQQQVKLEALCNEKFS